MNKTLTKRYTRTKEEKLIAQREWEKERAIKNGIYNGERQIFCRTKAEAFCKRYPIETELSKENVLTTLNDLNTLFGLNPKVIEDYENGQIDISYIDKDENAHILALEEDEVFIEAYKELRDCGVYPFHGVKWDGQASPVFLCYMTLPDEPLGIDPRTGLEIMPSCSCTAGIMTCCDYREIMIGVYFWINGVLYDDYVEFEGHDGAIYPVVAFPDLQEKDGIKASDIIVL